MILLDTSVIIDFFRKKNKEKSFFFELAAKEANFAISAVTYYEILVGSADREIEFWDAFFKFIDIIPFTPDIAKDASNIHKCLKKTNKLIEFNDLIIAATARHLSYSLATLNKKHFIRVKNLEVL